MDDPNVQSNWAGLDRQLAVQAETATPGTPVLGSERLSKVALATGLARDLQQVLRYALHEWPDVIRELNQPVSLKDRYEALSAYFYFMQLGDFPHPALQRTRIVLQLYFDLVYFRNSIMERLRRVICRLPARFGTLSYLTSWLELVGGGPYAGRLKVPRNAVAHGTWAFTEDFSAIVAYDERNTNPSLRSVRWRQKEPGEVHALLYAFHIVLFTVAKDEDPGGYR